MAYSLEQSLLSEPEVAYCLNLKLRKQYLDCKGSPTNAYLDCAMCDCSHGFESGYSLHGSSNSKTSSLRDIAIQLETPRILAKSESEDSLSPLRVEGGFTDGVVRNKMDSKDQQVLFKPRIRINILDHQPPLLYAIPGSGKCSSDSSY